MRGPCKLSFITLYCTQVLHWLLNDAFSLCACHYHIMASIWRGYNRSVNYTRKPRRSLRWEGVFVASLFALSVVVTSRTLEGCRYTGDRACLIDICSDHPTLSISQRQGECCDVVSHFTLLTVIRQVFIHRLELWSDSLCLSLRRLMTMMHTLTQCGSMVIPLLL